LNNESCTFREQTGKGFVAALKKMISMVLIPQTDSPEIKGVSQRRLKHTLQKETEAEIKRER